MIDDAKLQKVILGPDWIDLSFGEPLVVMQALYRQINRFGNPLKMPEQSDLLNWQYQPAAGKPDLISLLEDKYNAKVVVCNGAKQALAATLHSFALAGQTTIFYEKPYYPANSSLVKSAGLTWANVNEAGSYLITSPNNPDGATVSNMGLAQWRHLGPTIHDAAYYTPIYLPETQEVVAAGHVQIFSASKMYGLSGLRIGYAVCHDEQYYKDIVNYMETTTAGVSTASQDIVRNIESLFKDHPEYYKGFVSEARASIMASRAELSRLDPEVLTVLDADSNSMFAWCKVGSKLDNKGAKVHILDGSLFGTPGYMRMNIAHPTEIIREAVSRLNEHKIRN